MSYEPAVSTCLNRDNRYNTDLSKTQALPVVTPTSSSDALERLTAVDDAVFLTPSGRVRVAGRQPNAVDGGHWYVSVLSFRFPRQ